MPVPIILTVPTFSQLQHPISFEEEQLKASYTGGE
jgi:hypothetical protein